MQGFTYQTYCPIFSHKSGCMQIPLTYILMGITIVTSLMAFASPKVMNDFIFYPPAVTQRKQWWRFISCGFIHADYAHLGFNMLSYYFFGKMVEDTFEAILGSKGKMLYIGLYITALVISLLPTYFKHKNDQHYASLGASGAVSAIIFAGICINPAGKLGMFIGPEIPGFIFGPLYLVGCVIMDRRKRDNINHSAHFWGAVYGVVFFVAVCFIFTNINPFTFFVQQVSQYFQS